MKYASTRYYGKDIRKREVWEAVHGPIPDKHCLIYLDGNKNNIALENLACVSYSVMRSMAEQGLYSRDPEATRAGIAVAEHRVSVLRLIDKAIGQNIAILPNKIKNPIGCEKCLKAKCKHWYYSLRKKIPPSCAKYNLPITEITKIIDEYKAQLKAQPKKTRPISVETYLGRRKMEGESSNKKETKKEKSKEEPSQIKEKTMLSVKELKLKHPKLRNKSQYSRFQNTGRYTAKTLLGEANRYVPKLSMRESGGGPVHIESGGGSHYSSFH